MPTRDTMSKSVDSVVLASATGHTTSTGSSVDCQGYDSVRFDFFYGITGDTLSGSVYIESDIQVSDDNSTWVAAADTDIVVERSAATGNTNGQAVGTANGAHATGAAFLATASSQLAAATVVRVAYVGAHRYVRPVDTRAGTQTTGTSIQILAVQDNPSYEPTANSQVNLS